MNADILSKYNVPVPRYTSYPPANFFTSDFGESEFLRQVELSNEQQPEHLSFYIHIPFCKRICYYCGCNSHPMAVNPVVEAYVAAVIKEIDLVCAKLDEKRKIAQIHYGGGSPTAIPVEYIEKINKALLGKFDCIERPEIAIECHPGNMSLRDFEKLHAAGFNRMSLGIQDFNLDVLKAVNRIPSTLPVEQIVSFLKEKNININFDFIYGLPYQTVESFDESIARAVAMSPDRLVTFSYAHLPHIFTRQKVLQKRSIPGEELKNQIYLAAQKRILEAGYHPLGMDHFVKKEDELYLADKTFSLHRNFQGYCTRRTTGQVYAFGISGISQLATAYAQNTSDIDEYIKAIESGRIPIQRGYSLSNDQQITRELISTLMCNGQLDWAEVASNFNMSIDAIKAATAYSEEKMEEFQKDGLIIIEGDKIRMYEKSSPFVRNIAASLDKLQINTDKIFSKPI